MSCDNLCQIFILFSRAKVRLFLFCSKKLRKNFSATCLFVLVLGTQKFNTFLYKIIRKKLAYFDIFSYLCSGFRNEPNTMRNT